MGAYDGFRVGYQVRKGQGMFESFIEEADAEILPGDLDTHTDPHVKIDGKRYTLKAAYELAQFILENVEIETKIRYKIT